MIDASRMLNPEERHAADLESAADQVAYHYPKVALDLYKQAANTARPLGTKYPSNRQAQLALSFHKLGCTFIKAKEYSLGRDALIGAVDLRRILFNSDSNTYYTKHSYSESLHILSDVLIELELYAESRDISQEAAVLHRVFYASDPDKFRADLSHSLYNLGFSLEKLQLYSEACDAHQEAIELRRVLYASNPNAHRSDLAQSLHHLGHALNGLKLYDQTRHVSREAVELLRVLYASDPNGYRVDLSGSLYELGIALSELGLHSESQDAHQEVVVLHRVLYTSDPNAYRTKLADSLHILGSACIALERYSEAQNMYQQAVELKRGLYARDTDTYCSTLATTLERLAFTYDKLGSQSKAKAIAQEARVVQGLASKHVLPHKTPSPTYPVGAPPVFEDTKSKEQSAVPTRFANPSADNEPTTLIDGKWVPQPAGRGSYALVFRGTWNGHHVALKQLKPSHRGEKLQKRIRRESLIWQRQKHRNILPFLGTFTNMNNPDKFVYMISPWRENGNLQGFLEKNPDANIVDILYGVACALEYLHGQNPAVTHGDLRAVNILISEDNIPQLADFGLASLAQDTDDGDPGLLSADTSTVNRGGAVRWQAPELLDYDTDDERVERPRFTPASDIWSFSMVVIEVSTRNVPFMHIRSEFKVMDSVTKGQRPPRPDNANLSDALWECTNQCWAQEPEERPLASQLVSILSKLQ